MKRAVELVNGCYYHVFNKSISGFKIFLNNHEYERMINTFKYYQFENEYLAFSEFKSLKHADNSRFDDDKIVKIVAYCLMPTHIHLVLTQLKDDGISKFMRRVSNSYSRYFNIKHKRKGPLWQGRFRNVLVENDEQLQHLTRYVHLNPVTANIVKRPEDWKASSYLEYVSEDGLNGYLCAYMDVLDIDPVQYRKFVENRIDYQKQLGRIKRLILE